MFKKNKSINSGFTLVELLVVISIIGILSTVVLGSLQNARSKARDQYRISSLKQLANALELFYSVNNRYPTSGTGSWVYSCSPASGDWINDPAFPSPNGWSKNYLSSQPRDPQEAGCAANASPFGTPLGTPAGYGYYSDVAGTKYAIAARLENNSRYDIETTCQKSIVNGWYLYSACGSPGAGWNQTTFYIDNTYK